MWMLELFTQCLLHHNRSPFKGVSPRKSLRTQMDPCSERALKSLQSTPFHGLPNNNHSFLSSFPHNLCISPLLLTSSFAEHERCQWNWLEGCNVGPGLALLTSYRKKIVHFTTGFKGSISEEMIEDWSYSGSLHTIWHSVVWALAWEKKDQELPPIRYVIWTSHLTSLAHQKNGDHVTEFSW